MQNAPFVQNIIPAQDNFYALDIVFDENDKPCEFDKVPIIAWCISSGSENNENRRICSWFTSTAITPQSFADYRAVLYPDGRVEGIEQIFSSEQAWYEDFVKSCKDNPMKVEKKL